LKKFVSVLICLLCIFSPAFTVHAEHDLIRIEKSAYYDKTLSGFLSQIVGMLSGNEYKSSGGRYVVAMPDAWFAFCNGPYAGNTTYITHADKHLQNSENGIYEVWIDDDFGVDIFNQYILDDMYADAGFVHARGVSDGWLRYGIWDMGGGQRQVGAYGLITRQYYLPQFAGNGEFGNRYCYLSEPYIATDTLGMNAGGMPETAAMLAGTFALVTGDRDNVEWAKMFASMLSMAYFEHDIPTLIRSASQIFPEGSYSASLIDEIFALYQKYPQDWRAAFTAFEKNHYTEGITTGANTTVNCGFAILTLLYGGGDYMETTKIGSLAGYDCETSCGIALSVLGICGGTNVLPSAVNDLIWQDGRGVIVNRSPNGVEMGTYMHADNLPERMPIADIVQKYIQNFEHVLAERGGQADEKYYYIPREILHGYDTVRIENGGFETGSLRGFTVKGESAVLTPITTFGKYAAKLTGETELYTTVQGLTVGETYTLTAFIHATDRSAAYLFARDGKNGSCTTVYQTEGAAENVAYRAVKRSLLFTATASEMQIGIRFVPGEGLLQYATIDGITLLKADESSAGKVYIENEKADHCYKMLYTAVQAKKAGEHLLKLSFANKNAGIVDARILINGQGYGAAALSRTGPAGAELDAADCVYIPILLQEGHNAVTLSFGGYAVEITDASLVDIQYRK